MEFLWLPFPFNCPGTRPGRQEQTLGKGETAEGSKGKTKKLKKHKLNGKGCRQHNASKIFIRCSAKRVVSPPPFTFAGPSSVGFLLAFYLLCIVFRRCVPCLQHTQNLFQTVFATCWTDIFIIYDVFYVEALCTNMFTLVLDASNRDLFALELFSCSL